MLDPIGDCFGGVYIDKTIEIPDNYQIHTDTLNWVKPLEFGAVIDSKLNWCEDNSLILYRLSGVSGPGQGYWFWTNITDAKYIGIRKIVVPDTIYGWFLLDARDIIKLKEYTFNQPLK